MPNRDRVFEAVYTAVDEINHQLPLADRLAKRPDTVVHGQIGGLDSLGLISLFVSTERILKDTFGRTVALTNELASPSPQVRLDTLGGMVDYIIDFMEKSGNV